MTTTNYPTVPCEGKQAEAFVPGEAFPIPGTPAWDQMNRRRGELIQKKVDASLTPQEQAEYEYLQRMSLAAVNQAHPGPPVDLAALQQLEAELRGQTK